MGYAAPVPAILPRKWCEMFGIGLPELILIMAVALIVVGPDKLPGLARGLAKQIVELKKAANVLKDSLTEDEPEKKSWDKDLPVGFSRPEELARAGRKASSLAHNSGFSDDDSRSGPEEERPADEQGENAAPEESLGDIDSGAGIDLKEMAEKEK